LAASKALPGQIRSLFVIRLATEASKHAAHFQGRAAGVIEVSGSLAPLAFSISFGGIEQTGYGRSIELINQLPPA
jgi:hypothetical protein